MASSTMANLPAPARMETVRGEVVDVEPIRATEQQVKDALREGKTALWKLAEALWHFDQQKGWAALGKEHLTEWLKDPEIDMTRGTYYRLVGTWQKLAIDRGLERKQLEAVDMSKAALVADEIATGHRRPATVLKDVQELPASKLREKYGKPRRGRPTKMEQTGHTPAAALKAASELPWDFFEGAIGRGNLNLREARLREAIQVLLDWRSEYLA